MVIGLRILALMIDVAFCFGTLPMLLTGATLCFELCPFGIVLFPFLFHLIIFMWPLLYLAIPTGLWGKTLGKLICRLSVTDYRERAPGFWHALGREVLKCLAIGSGIGAVITLFQVIYQGETWYDNLCGTSVEFKPYIRLTQTQKNWRKLYKKR